MEPRYTEIGHVFVVGSGDCGQLGLGPDVLEKERLAIISYFSDKNIVAVFAGGMHNIALDANGKLYSWGCNDQKALGRSGEETIPLPVHGLDDEFVIDVACGDSVTLVLTQTGKVYGWGTFRDKTGIFGFSPSAKEQGVPAPISDLKNIVSISSGADHLVAINNQGKIYTWGVGEQGQLGRKVTPRQLVESSLTPRTINFKPYRMTAKFLSAYCGAYHTFLIHETHSVFAFGLNNYGQLGCGDTDEHTNPELVEGIKDKIAMVSGGMHHSLVLTEKGSVYVFGRGDSGQLGLPEKKEVVDEPKIIKALQNVRQVSAGGAFSLAVTKDKANNLWAWGYGEMGQLANSSEDSDMPFQVLIKDRHVIQAAAGGQHTVLLISPKEA